MRFIDRYAIDHPGKVSFDENGAASDYMIGCPCTHGYETREESYAVCGSVSCKWCWEREMVEPIDIDTANWDLSDITKEVFEIEV